MGRQELDAAWREVNIAEVYRLNCGHAERWTFDLEICLITRRNRLLDVGNLKRTNSGLLVMFMIYSPIAEEKKLIARVKICSFDTTRCINATSRQLILDTLVDEASLSYRCSGYIAKSKVEPTKFQAQ
jgi:hypothetical protein